MKSDRIITINLHELSQKDDNPQPALATVSDMEEISTLRIENKTQGDEEFECGDQSLCFLLLFLALIV